MCRPSSVILLMRLAARPLTCVRPGDSVAARQSPRRSSARTHPVTLFMNRARPETDRMLAAARAETAAA